MVVLLGALAAQSPMMAAGVIVCGVVVAGAFVAPAANLVLIVFLTAIVPFSVQNGLTQGARGLIPSDLFLLAGLLRVVPGLLAGAPLQRRQGILLVMLAGFWAVAVLDFGRGLAAGHDPSIAGTELRTLLGFSTFVVALPILSDERRRNRVLSGLLFVGLLLGLWGMAQWLFDIRFAGEFGVREGINFTSSGRGQLQGGLYAFPVAAVLAFAALTSPAVRSGRQRALLVTVTILNLVCVVLTYERTFWVATCVGLGFVVLRAGSGPRAWATLWGSGLALVVLAGMATLAPGALSAARERLISLGQYATDGSVRYRVVESEHVIDAISDHPVLGSGLGAKIVWVRPWEQVPARAYHYSHNGYLWLAWKVGLPAAALLFAAFLLAIGWRATPTDDRLGRATRHGCQGSLLLLMIGSVTFPSFNTFGITATMGLLLAFCATSLRGGERGPAGEARTESVAVI